MLKGPSWANNARNTSRSRRMIESRDGHEGASATALSAVGTHFNDNGNHNQYLDQEVVGGPVLGSSTVIALTAAVLSISIGTCARRKTSGWVSQN